MASNPATMQINIDFAHSARLVEEKIDSGLINRSLMMVARTKPQIAATAAMKRPGVEKRRWPENNSNETKTSTPVERGIL